jgi:hypothetical protein
MIHYITHINLAVINNSFIYVQVVRAFSSQRMQLILAQNDQPTSDSGPVTLQTQHVQGPLLFLGSGLLVASLVFIMEVLKKSNSFNINLYIPQ